MSKTRHVLLALAIAVVVGAAAAGGGMSAWDRHREAEDQAEYAEMACSFHMAIDSSDDRAPGLLVQVVTSAVRSGNQRLWSVAYDLQQDVVKFGAASEQVVADRTRLASLCGPILN